MMMSLIAICARVLYIGFFYNLAKALEKSDKKPELRDILIAMNCEKVN